MNTRVLVILSLFLGIGTVLHFVLPPIYGVTPDMMLAMMFLGIMLFPKLKYVMIVSLATGLLSALATSAPGGQIANMVDKPITGLVFFTLFLLLKGRVGMGIVAPVLTAIGTITSGSIFLTVILYILGTLEGTFFLALPAVLIAAGLNTVVMIIIYPIVQQIMKRSQPVVIN